MQLSRRDALRAGGGLLAGGTLAGCVERRVTRRETNVESSTTWVLNPGTGNRLDADAFGAYVDEMGSVYGDSGVWGLGEPADAEFEAAYAQRLPIVREASGQPGGAQPTLVPDEVDRAANFPVVDAALSMYRVDASRYRYWLWAVADLRNETFARDADASVLTAGVSVRGGDVEATAAVASDGGEATVDLESGTVGRFPLRETTDGVGTVEERGAEGHYVVEWTGGVGGIQSINGVCEVAREGNHDLRWTVGGGYVVDEQV